MPSERKLIKWNAKKKEMGEVNESGYPATYRPKKLHWTECDSVMRWSNHETEWLRRYEWSPLRAAYWARKINPNFFRSNLRGAVPLPTYPQFLSVCRVRPQESRVKISRGLDALWRSYKNFKNWKNAFFQLFWCMRRKLFLPHLPLLWSLKEKILFTKNCLLASPLPGDILSF